MVLFLAVGYGFLVLSDMKWPEEDLKSYLHFKGLLRRIWYLQHKRQKEGQQLCDVTQRKER